MTPLPIGVLALQGDVAEHTAALRAVGAHPVPVRRPAELGAVTGLVLPGGESTAIGRLLEVAGLTGPLRAAVAGGLPVFGSCAGMILLARELVDGEAGQPTLGGLDVTVRRNAFGRQVDSFETDLDVADLDGAGVPGRLHAVFIRAPRVERAGPGVRVLARTGPAHGDSIVAVRERNVLATAFHPEATGDRRLHALFLEMVRTGRVPPVG